MINNPRLTLFGEPDRNISGTIIDEPAFSGYFDLASPVGPSRDNRRGDVIKVETMLGNTGHYDLRKTDGPTGYHGARLDDAIRKYQGENGLKVDGLLNRRGPTVGSLRGKLGKALARHRPPTAREVDNHHERLARGLPGLLNHKPQPLKIRPRQDLPTVLLGDSTANERTVDHLRTTLELGDLPKYLAADVTDRGATGIAVVRELLGMAKAELGEDRTNELGATLFDHLAPDQQRDLLGGEPPKQMPVGVLMAENRESAEPLGETGDAAASDRPRPPAGGPRPATHLARISHEG